jgi:hypothetical protein
MIYPIMPRYKNSPKKLIKPIMTAKSTSMEPNNIFAVFISGFNIPFYAYILVVMDSLQDILGKKNFTPPDEVTAIRDYIKRRYDSNSYVKVEKSAIIVSVPSSGLAATIYLERQTLIEHCNLKQRLLVRSGRQ